MSDDLFVDTLARRAKQIQDACAQLGCIPEVIAAAVIADRIEDIRIVLGEIDDSIGRIGSTR